MINQMNEMLLGYLVQDESVVIKKENNYKYYLSKQDK